VHKLVPVFLKCCTHPAKCTSLQILQKFVAKFVHVVSEYLLTNENTIGELLNL
jgi:hypothetical protein